MNWFHLFCVPNCRVNLRLAILFHSVINSANRSVRHVCYNLSSNATLFSVSIGVYLHVWVNVPLLMGVKAPQHPACCFLALHILISLIYIYKEVLTYVTNYSDSLL